MQSILTPSWDIGISWAFLLTHNSPTPYALRHCHLWDSFASPVRQPNQLRSEGRWRLTRRCDWRSKSEVERGCKNMTKSYGIHWIWVRKRDLSLYFLPMCINSPLDSTCFVVNILILISLDMFGFRMSATSHKMGQKPPQPYHRWLLTPIKIR